MSVPHPERADAPPDGGPSALAGPDDALPAPWRPFWGGQGPVVAAVALGGGIGAAARYGASLLWPAQTGGFPWTTFGVNVVGCAVIGVLMVLITDVWAAPRLVRPFFGTGVLGGFTTFSTYAVDTQRLADAGHAPTGFAYLAATPCAALAAVWLAVTATRRTLTGRHR
ncbi:fluoride efflux transporter CrcB [Streptomyces sp. NPDC005551]|uniref:fluoride efflux transporter CrcB n=1 Tax=Streptomyces sp. NPDC005551 TaxID=3364725 RepID=UPI00367B7CA6